MQASEHPVAQLIDLTKEFDLGEPSSCVHLRGVNLTIPEGDFVSIMGSSGSGKSTMLNILGALDRPTAGEYILDGEDTSRMSDDELSNIRNQRIGFIFQSFNLIAQYTVTENISVPMHYRPGYPPISKEDLERVEHLAGIVGLKDRLDHRPFQLSGGQQQRVAIARSLVNNPAVVMADEPTGNLDSKTEEEIMEILIRLNEDEGRTIIMVTHEPAVAKRTKRQVVMKDGLIDREGVFGDEL